MKGFLAAHRLHTHGVKQKKVLKKGKTTAKSAPSVGLVKHMIVNTIVPRKRIIVVGKNLVPVTTKLAISKSPKKRKYRAVDPVAKLKTGIAKRMKFWEAAKRQKLSRGWKAVDLSASGGSSLFSTKYSWVQVVSGGLPGLGKRR